MCSSHALGLTGMAAAPRRTPGAGHGHWRCERRQSSARLRRAAGSTSRARPARVDAAGRSGTEEGAAACGWAAAARVWTPPCPIEPLNPPVIYDKK